MARRRVIGGTSIAFAAAIIVSFAAAQAGHAGSQSPAGSVSSIERFYIHETWNGFSGIKGKAKPGDVYVFQDVLSDMHGTRVGTANGAAIDLRPPYVGWNATAVLPGGSLTVAGTYSLGGVRELFIVGGSGSYDGARGTVTLSDAGAKGDLATVVLVK